jgi:hypothetical protein
MRDGRSRQFSGVHCENIGDDDFNLSCYVSVPNIGDTEVVPLADDIAAVGRDIRLSSELYLYPWSAPVGQPKLEEEGDDHSSKSGETGYPLTHFGGGENANACQAMLDHR